MLADARWWKSLGVLLFRQALQVAVPVLVLVVQAEGKVDVPAVAAGLAGAVAVTVFAGFWRALRDVPDTTFFGRVVRAGAGVFAGLAVTDLGGFLAVDWRAVVVAACAAMLVAAVHVIDPPAVVPGVVE